MDGIAFAGLAAVDEVPSFEAQALLQFGLRVLQAKWCGLEVLQAAEGAES